MRVSWKISDMSTHSWKMLLLINQAERSLEGNADISAKHLKLFSLCSDSDSNQKMCVWHHRLQHTVRQHCCRQKQSPDKVLKQEPASTIIRCKCNWTLSEHDISMCSSEIYSLKHYVQIKKSRKIWLTQAPPTLLTYNWLIFFTEWQAPVS